MVNPVLKKTIALSLLGHMSLFGLFSFSFGTKLGNPHYGNIAFWGEILKKYDFSTPLPTGKIDKFISVANRQMVEKASPEKKNSVKLPLENNYIKPYVDIALYRQKETISPVVYSNVFKQERKEPIVTFYPILPSQFNLYFKDRQRAYIELEYNISKDNSSKNISIKRKISSGNLEADLICMRYIEHYLAIQEERLSSDKWQRVKIELEQKR